MNFKEKDLSLLIKAVKFSADKHKTQRRKGAEGSPYINHPIDVAETLWNVGGVRRISVIIAAILHDTVEDTKTTLSEIEEGFGAVVRSLVQEVTDDKTLPKPKRKRLQIEHAPHLSRGAKQIKLADKISNVNDVAFAPPAHWPHKRRVDYLSWADKVVGGLRGCNKQLEQLFDKTIGEARLKLESEGPPFRVMIDDNFHFMDEDERIESGTFQTYEAAVKAAKKIVDRSLRWERSQCKNPTNPKELYHRYTDFGDDPFVMPQPPGEHFSAWGFAEQRCHDICREPLSRGRRTRK